MNFHVRLQQEECVVEAEACKQCGAGRYSSQVFALVSWM